jgi:hypothetical protein
MMILVKRSGAQHAFNIQQAAKEEVNGASIGPETAAAESAALVGRMLQKLHEKGILFDEDVLEVLPSFRAQ